MGLNQTDETIRVLKKWINDTISQFAIFFIAEVTSTSPLQVKRIGSTDSDAFTVKTLVSYTSPTIGDNILLFRLGQLKIIIGEIA